MTEVGCKCYMLRSGLEVWGDRVGRAFNISGQRRVLALQGEMRRRLQA